MHERRTTRRVLLFECPGRGEATCRHLARTMPLWTVWANLQGGHTSELDGAVTISTGECGDKGTVGRKDECNAVLYHREIHAKSARGHGQEPKYQPSCRSRETGDCRRRQGRGDVRHHDRGPRCDCDL